MWWSTPKWRTIAATVTPWWFIPAAAAAIRWYTGTGTTARNSASNGSSAKVRSLCVRVRLDAVDWREGVLSITQAKTGRVLTLPLLPEVADALLAYLRDGRPATTSRHVFVRHKAPFEPFVARNNLATIMRQALQRVGLDQREGRRGLYLLRHTLASRMLASGSPLKRIGDVLGHASTDATMEYASVDLTALRRVAISETEVRP